MNNPRPSFHVLVLAVLAALATALPPSAGATTGASDSNSDDATRLDTITVLGSADDSAEVATRVAIPALDTPFTIVALPSTLIDATAATSLSDIMRYGGMVGGTDNFGNAGEFFSGRGFQLDAGRNYFRDGLRHRKFGPTPLYNLERIEVLRGPASILYGAVQPGGVVNFVSRRPSADAAQRYRVRSGSDDFRQVTADVTGPVGNAARLRVQGLYEDAGSFRDFADSRSRGADAALQVDIGPATLVEFRLAAFDDHRGGDRGTTTVRRADGSVEIADLPRSRNLGDPFASHDFREVNLGVSIRHTLGERWEWRADFSAADQREDRVYIWGGPPALDDPVPVSGLMNRTVGEWEADLRGALLRTELVGTLDFGSTRHQLLIGVDGERFRNARENRRFAYPAIDIFNPVVRASRPDTAQTGNFPFQGATRTRSAYVQNIATLSPRWVALAGLRYDRLSDENRVASTTREDRATTPQAGLVFKASEEWSVYGSYARSFVPQGGIDRDGRPLDPQESSQNEIGVKFGSRRYATHATLAAFELNKRKLAVTDPDFPLFQRLSGLQRSRGIEASVLAQPLEGLNLSLNLNYIEQARFLIDDRLAGNTIRNVPRLIGGAWLEYTPPSGPLRDLSSGIGLVHVGERFGNDRNQFQLPHYSLVDLGFRYRISDQLRASLNLKNVFDKHHFTGALAHRTITVGAPRTLLLGLEFQFD